MTTGGNNLSNHETYCKNTQNGTEQIHNSHKNKFLTFCIYQERTGHYYIAKL